MPNLIDLEKRLRLLGITNDTKHNIGVFYPHFLNAIDDIAGQFYAHLLSFPEGKSLLADQDIKNSLKPRQQAHWIELFACQFNERYVTNALRVGQIHYKRKIAPYLYMAGYNFFHCQIISVASQHFGTALELPNLLASITRVVTLDMDLALSAYTREHWRQLQGAA
jgi:hypothetical protein